MNDDNTSRLSRLTAILTQLQTKRLTTATELADKFGVSVRTIYRDIRSLEKSGVPVLTEEGRGYTIMDGYRLPPVSFSESEAHALITAQQFVLLNKDASFVREHTNAIEKIKAVLRYQAKEGAELLSTRMAVTLNYHQESSSQYLSQVQLALTKFQVLQISYKKETDGEASTRLIEPFALLSTQGNWLLVAWCRLRHGFRLFRLDRIHQMAMLDEKFEPHPMTLQEYFQISQKKPSDP